MPKQLHEVKTFNRGTILNASLSDIPEEAATHSKNIDGAKGNGRLVSINTDRTLKTTSNAISDAFLLGNENSDMVVLTDQSTVGIVHDLYDGDIDGAVDTLLTLPDPAQKMSAVVRNDIAYIGMGKEVSPKWVGTPKYTQFSNTSVGNICVDSEVNNNSLLPSLDKIVSFTETTDWLAAIHVGGTEMYKFAVSATDTLAATVTGFTNIRSICKGPAGFFFLLEKLPGSFVIRKIYDGTGATFGDIASTWILPIASGIPTGVEYSDIIVPQDGADNFLWVACHGTDFVPAITNEFLFNFDTTSDVFDNVITLSSITPKQEGGVAPGDWARYESTGVEIDDEYGQGDWQLNWEDIIATDTPFSKTIRFSLTDCGAGYAGWYCQIADQLVNQDNGQYDVTIYPVMVELYGTLSYHTRLGCLFVIAEAEALNHIGTHYSVSTNFEDLLSIHNVFVKNVSGLKLFLARNKIVNRYTTSIVVGNADGSDNTMGVIAGNTSHGFSNVGVWNYDTTPLLSIPYLNSGWGGYASLADGFADNTAPTDEYDSTNISVGVGNSANPSDFSASGTDSYFYKIALVYDGYQESPLTQGLGVVPATSANTKDVTLTISDITKLDPRITHISVYRASGTFASAEDSSYELIKSVSMTDTGWTSGYAYAFVDDKVTNVYGSYEAINGISEELDRTIVNYTVSTDLNGFLFVGDAMIIDTSEDASNYIFRSKAGKYSIFDWSNDYLVLPEKPIALSSYLGRLFAFTSNTMYRINPDNLYIEDSYVIGELYGEKAVISNDYGMCFATNTGIYLYDGKSLSPISKPIDRAPDGDTTKMGWLDVHKREVKIAFDVQRKAFYVYFKPVFYLTNDFIPLFSGSGNDDMVVIPESIRNYSGSNKTAYEIKVMAGATQATGNISFSGQPSGSDTIVLNGITFTFRAGASTIATDISIQGNLSDTLVEAASVYNLITTGAVSLATASSDATRLLLTYDTDSYKGNSYKLDASGCSVGTASGAYLTGGVSDLYKISTDGGSSYDDNSGAGYRTSEISSGIVGDLRIVFGADNGHTVDDNWAFTIYVSDPNIWVYSLNEQRWDLWGTYDLSNVLVTPKRGLPVLVDSTGIIKEITGQEDTYREWLWESKVFDMGAGSVQKRLKSLYFPNIVGEASLNTNLKVKGGEIPTSLSTLTLATTTTTGKYSIAGANRVARYAQVVIDYISGSVTDANMFGHYTDYIGLVYRLKALR